MTDLKIALAVDPSTAYLDYIVSEYAETWAKGQMISRVTDLKRFGGRTLFGDEPFAILTLENSAAVKEAAKYFGDNDAETLAKRFPTGILVLSSVSQTYTRTLKKVFTDLGANLHMKASKDRKSLPSELVDQTNLSREVKDFLLDFAAAEPEHVLPIVRQVKKLPEKQQAALSLASIEVRMPQSPEHAPTWDIDDPMWAGNAAKAISTAHRIVGEDKKRVALVLWQLRKATRAVLVLSGIGSNHGLEKKELADLAGLLPNYGLVVAQRQAKKTGVANASKIIEVVSKYDRMIRGGSHIDNVTLLEMALIEITQIVRS